MRQLGRVLVVTLTAVASVTAVLLPGGYLDDHLPPVASVAMFVADLSLREAISAPAEAEELEEDLPAMRAPATEAMPAMPMDHPSASK